MLSGCFIVSSFLFFLTAIYSDGMVIFWDSMLWFLSLFLQILNFLFCIVVKLTNTIVMVSGEQWRDSATHTHVCLLSRFSHVQLFVTMDYSPPVFSIRGILQARILDWVAVPSSRGSSQQRDQTLASPTLQADSLPLSHWGSPHIHISLLFFFCEYILGFCLMATMRHT